MSDDSVVASSFWRSFHHPSRESPSATVTFAMLVLLVSRAFAAALWRAASLSGINTCFDRDSNPSEGFSQIGNELNKKRKLLCELSDSELPVSKHKFKFRDGLNSFNHESMAKEVTQHEEILPRGKEIGERPEEEEEESDRDSIISIEDYDSAIQANVRGGTEKLSGRLAFRDRPSTSSNSSSNNASGSSITSFDSDNSATVNSMPENGQSENDFQSASEYKDVTVLLQGFEEYDDNITSEILRNSMECSDAEMLPSAFVLPSGQWGLGQEARLGASKLTIDQEFEQYFSTLML